jgi:hypothetical protein
MECPVKAVKRPWAPIICVLSRGSGGVIMGAGAVMVGNGMLYVTSSNCSSSAVLLAFSKAH